MGHEENDELKPLRKNSDLSDDFEDEDPDDELILPNE
jgi:hypothetical protein